MKGTATIVLMLTLCTSVSDASYFEEKLLEDLISKNKHRTDMRPVFNDSDAVVVTIGLSLSQIIDVDGKNQIMTTSVWTRQKWFNPYLRWNKSEYGNITSINVKSSRIWLPDLVLYNNADESIDFRGNLDRLATRVKISHDGTNVWLAPVMLKSKCKINVEYFPFDSQNCSLKFGSWTYDLKRIDVKEESKSVDLMKYGKSGEWYLASAPVRRNEVKYFCCPEKYPDVTFYFIIQRRTLFYLTNLILPLVIISALIVFVFTLPPQSGERISLSITLLLSMMVFMLMITENIPATSEVVPLIAKFYMAVMIEMAVALVTTCYVLRCYHSGASKVPGWVRRYFVVRLANFLGVKKSKALKDEEETLKTLCEESGLLERIVNHDTPRAVEDIEKRFSSCIVDMNDIHHLHVPAAENHSSHPPIWGRSKDVGEQMLHHLEIISDDIQAKDKGDLMQEEWLIFATVIDRLAMWISSVVIIATVFIIFYQAPGYVS